MGWGAGGSCHPEVKLAARINSVHQSISAVPDPQESTAMSSLHPEAKPQLTIVTRYSVKNRGRPDVTSRVESSPLLSVHF